MSLNKKIMNTLEELNDIKLIFSVVLILIGLIDIWHVSDYVRNYDEQYTESLGYNGAKLLNQELQLPADLTQKEEIYFQERTKGLPQKDFFNAIFMLCTGFTVLLWGSFKFYLWFERREILKLIKEGEK